MVHAPLNDHVKQILLRYGRTLLRSGPWAGPLSRAVGLVRRHRFSSADYWERRYASGGDSGIGSYGELASYKADVLNAFVEREGIGTVVEFGCGDGNQLALYHFPSYLGLDVSPSAIERCRTRFAADPSKRFLVYPVTEGERLDAELSLSIDVLYHLVEDAVLFAYLRDLFAAGRRYVIVYSTDFDRRYDSPHQVDRRVTAIVAERFPEFELVDTIVNPNKGEETMSDFFIYRRVAP